MNILLMRHGPPDFDASRWLHRHELQALLTEYANARVTAEPTPAARALAASSEVGAVVSSTLARSIDSARALGHGDALPLPGLDEAELPCPARSRWPLPYGVAVPLLRIGWFAGWSPNAATLRETRTRARGAVPRLVDLARAHGTVLVVGHGIVNGLVARELVRAGWGRRNRGRSGYWSVTRMSDTAD